jgi:hypothetical protein
VPIFPSTAGSSASSTSKEPSDEENPRYLGCRTLNPQRGDGGRGVSVVIVQYGQGWPDVLRVEEREKARTYVRARGGVQADQPSLRRAGADPRLGARQRKPSNIEPDWLPPKDWTSDDDEGDAGSSRVSIPPEFRQHLPRDHPLVTV